MAFIPRRNERVIVLGAFACFFLKKIFCLCISSGARAKENRFSTINAAAYNWMELMWVWMGKAQFYSATI